MEKVIGLDLDGVIYPFHEALYTYAQYELDYEGTFREFWNSFVNEFSTEKKDYLVSIPIVYEQTVPSKETMELLANLTSDSELFYITGRALDLERVTRRYLSRYHFPKQDNLIFSADKITTCRLYGVTHFLDDFPHIVRDVQNVCDAYVMWKPWFQDRLEGLKVVRSLKEFVDRVLKI
jgi:uncharacterized HAD superfamily protein